MNQKTLLLLVTLLYLHQTSSFNITEAIKSIGRKKQSVSVRGRLLCQNNPIGGVKVKLYDHDHFTLDDLMDAGYSSQNGYFLLAGYSKEIMTLNTHLNVYHRCNYTTQIPTCFQKFTIKIPKSYVLEAEVPDLTKGYDVGQIKLEEPQPGQSTDCVNLS
ncbi:unnamed protein product [Bursaphelenchus xylophilus]|uniref:(pine wood nematode) hypothetical protein n=1 Tax=Bursaphelenchus xylophilus TaxID=6326 RepID=A0A1I7SCR8_BURXY|nr:unnamed protein product [Bursaphelenchus xylophilus]CAG9093632.1 unnamed protein product [Bursaphelenchus xylophilus]